MKIRFIIKENNFSYFSKWETFLNSIIPDYPDDSKKFAIMQKELYEYGFKYLSDGSYRTVFAFPDKQPYVLKVAKRYIAKAMNEKEVDTKIQTKYSHILPKSYIRSKDCSWIVVERVDQATPEDVFEQVEGTEDYREFVAFLKRVKANATTMKVGPAIEAAMKRYGIKNISHSIQMIINFSIEYDIAVWDLWSRNLGVTEDLRLVILDASFEKDFNNE